MQPITHLDPRMSACLQACIMRAVVEFCSNPDPSKRSRPYPAFTSLMAGEYDPAWTFRPTCPGRRIHPNMIPSSQRQLLPLLNHHKHRTKKPETYLPRQFETRLKMDPAHGGQQFEHISSCMPWSVNTAHSSRRYMWPPKNTPHAAKAPRNPSNTWLNRKNSMLSHHISKMGRLFLRMSTFSVQVTRTPPSKPLNTERP